MMSEVAMGTEKREETVSSRRAVYEVPENIFEIRRPSVPAHLFVDERDKAFSESTPSGPINLDLSDQLGFDYPATTPFLLARYLRVRSGENVSAELIAGGEIHYVIRGSGESRNRSDQIAWRAGDVFCFPGGARTVHHANEHDAVLLQFTDEPLYAFTQAQPPAEGAAVVEAVHHLGERIDEELDNLYRLGAGEESSGMAVQLMSRSTRRRGTCLPSIALAVNSLAGGTSQRPHVHNAVALTLCIQGADCFSLVDGERVEWQPNAVMVTPPTAVHSHHNHGDKRMKCLIAQDAGLYYHARTAGFSFVD